MSDIWAVIPVKEFDGAKHRLSGLLSPPERLVLAATMLADMLDAGLNPVEETAIAKIQGTVLTSTAFVIGSLTAPDLNASASQPTRRFPAEVPNSVIPKIMAAVIVERRLSATRSCRQANNGP